MSSANDTLQPRKPPRKRLSFGLRAVFVVVTLAAVVLVLLRIWLETYGARWTAIAKLRSMGANVVTIPDPEAPLMRAFFGDAYVQDVSTISFFPIDVLRGQIEYIPEYGVIRTDTDRVMPATHVTDDELELIQNFRSIRELNINATKATDKSLRFLNGLKQLESLNLSQTQITDQGLVHVAACKNLTTLDLSHTEVSDKGMQFIYDLTQLIVLNLSDTDVTDSGLKQLSNLSNLKELHLARTIITDEGLMVLRQSKVSVLVLSGTNVTDQGLKELSRLSTLNQLNLANTHVTMAAIQELQRVAPGLTIEFGPVAPNRDLLKSQFDMMKAYQESLNAAPPDGESSSSERRRPQPEVPSLHP